MTQTVTTSATQPAAAPPPRPSKFPEYPSARAAADAAITHAMERPAEAPAYFPCVIRRQDGVVTTRDTVEAAVRAAQRDRLARVDLSALAVGCVWVEPGAVTMLIEGLRRS